MEKNIKILVLVVIALVVLGGLWFIFTKNNQSASPVDTTTTTEPSSMQDITAQDIGAGAASISYTDALVKYADRRIQLDKNCQTQVSSITYKDNTGIMIDNRSSEARTVKVGITFTIKPWGFKIVVLPDVYLKSKTLLVDCDQYQNVATVLVQE